MSLDVLRTAKKVIGVKQASKAVDKGLVELVYLAKDADGRVTSPLKEACVRLEVTVEEGFTMVELGKACGIEVGAAAVAVLK